MQEILLTTAITALKQMQMIKAIENDVFVDWMLMAGVREFESTAIKFLTL
jgi:glycerol-3-phosphate responsive antiterminator